jgi:LacI family transcriptional regulator
MSNLRVDYAEGIKQAVLHLVELGHRDIAFVSGPEHLRSARRRLEAFRQTLREVLPAEKERIFRGDFKVEGGKAAAAEILAEKRLPTAVIAANDLMAFGAISEFRAAGVNVPRDVSIVGFDDITFASLTEPALTTVNLPRRELGQKAVEALLATGANSAQPGVEFAISTQLIVRQTTAGARNKAKARSVNE